MRARFLPLGVALLTGCIRPLAPVGAIDATLTPALGLFQTPVQVRLAWPRRVQTLPGEWDSVQISVDSAKLRAPLAQVIATSSTTVAATFAAPPGAATVSVQLSFGGQVVALGQTPVNLTPGLNPVSINLFAPFLASVTPPLAKPGDTVYFEGNFGTTVTANFPGAGALAIPGATLHRATASVPTGASSGGTWLTTGGANSNALPLRIPGFTPGLARWQSEYEQAASGHASSSLAVARSFAAAVATAHDVYVVGGENGSELGSVERARLHADGTLSEFSTLPVSLQVARSRHAAVVLGKYLYAIGGMDAGGTLLASVERAAIQPDGSLGTFQVIPGLTLQSARSGIALAIAGSHLFVVGGENAFPEVSDILPDGTLTGFSLASFGLINARKFATCHVIGHRLYVVGGSVGGSPATSIENCALDADGNLTGGFANAAVMLYSATSGQASAVIGHTLYVLGGTDGTNAISTVQTSPIDGSDNLGSFTFNMYAPTTSPRNGAASVMIGDRLYLMGGQNANGMLGSVEFASLNASGNLGSFAEVGPTMLTAREGGAAVVLGQKAYLIGGDPALSSIQVATVQADGTLGSFSDAGISLTTPRKGHTVVVNHGYVYAIGGMDGSNAYLMSVERAAIQPDGTLGNFSFYANMTRDHAYASSIAVGNHLYVFGGVNGAGSSVDCAYLNSDGSLGSFYNPGWILDYSRSHAACFALGGKVFLVGGDGTPAASVSAGNFDAAGNITSFYDTGLTLATGRTGHSVAVLGNSVYVLGGDAGGVTQTSVERATLDNTGVLGTFTLLGSGLTTARRGPASLVLGDRLFVLSGYNGSAYSTSIEAAPLQ